jgi:hypothetical protein
LPTIGKDSLPHPADEAHGARRGRAASWRRVREVESVLSSQEQQIWDDVLRFWSEEAVEPPRATPSAEGSPSDQAELPIAVVAGAWITITLVFLGMMGAALTVGLTTAFGWAVWHHWPRLSGQSAPGPTTGRRWISD